MNILQSFISFFKGGAADSNNETKSSEGAITIDMLGSKYGSTMSETKAMKIEAFYSCIRDKAETIGQLPLKLYRVSREGRQQVLQGRNHRIFTEQPCEYLTLQEFLEMMVSSLEINGAFYAYPVRNDRGEVMEIIPFAHQRNVVPNMDVNGNVYFTYVTNDGKPVMAAYASDLFIVQLFTLNGYMPVRPIWYNSRLLGIADAQDKSYEELQTKGITSQMALKTPNAFKDDNAVARLREDMKQMRGPKGSSFTPIFEQGLEPVFLRLSPKEAELLGNKQFTVNRICRMVRVSPHRVGIEMGSVGTKSTVSELDEAYMRDSLNPILVKVEKAFNAFLPEGYKVEFNRKAFYAGSPWRLVESVEREVKGGLASINEGRIDLGRETIEGGDVFAIDNNNVTYGKWTEIDKIQQQLYGRANNNGGNDNASTTPTE